MGPFGCLSIVSCRSQQETIGSAVNLASDGGWVRNVEQAEAVDHRHSFVDIEPAISKEDMAVVWFKVREIFVMLRVEGGFCHHVTSPGYDQSDPATAYRATTLEMLSRAEVSTALRAVDSRSH